MRHLGLAASHSWAEPGREGLLRRVLDWPRRAGRIDCWCSCGVREFRMFRAVDNSIEGHSLGWPEGGGRQGRRPDRYRTRPHLAGHVMSSCAAEFPVVSCAGTQRADLVGTPSNEPLGRVSLAVFLGS